MRTLVSSYLRKSKEKNNIHVFVEANIDDLLKVKKSYKDRGLDFSFPVYVLFCFGQLLHRYPNLFSMRWGNRWVQFDNADILTVIEREEKDGVKVPMSYIVRDAGRKTYHEILSEVRRAQQSNPEDIHEVRKRRKLLNLPHWLIAWIVAFFQSTPQRYCRYYGNAAFTAPVRGNTNRFSIGVPISSSTTALLLNGQYKKVVKGELGFEEKDFIGFTFVVDHDIIDGAQGMRIAEDFCSMIESSFGLINPIENSSIGKELKDNENLL
jgi:pyruvate/2-oxoglutarate dehydrogenase complex dihydrolipoamide acyltransferase (E2) component